MLEALFVVQFAVLIIFIIVALGALAYLIYITASMKRIQYLEQKQERVYREETKPVTVVEQEAFLEERNEKYCGECKYYRENFCNGVLYRHCGKRMRFELGAHGYSHPVFVLKRPGSRACESFQDRSKQERE